MPDSSKNYYAFILGSNPTLSIAEILAVLPEAVVLQATPEFLVIETSQIEFPQKMLDRLGGTVKIYQISNTKSQTESIQLEIIKFFNAHSIISKLAFAVNVFGRKDKQLQKKLILDTKKYLRDKEISCRFVNQDFKNTTSVQSFHEKLTSKGIEIGVFYLSHPLLRKEGSASTLLLTKGEMEGVSVGKLVASQNIEFYSQRDYSKPERNMKVGLMPPKLAQILINLAGLTSALFGKKGLGFSTLRDRPSGSNSNEEISSSIIYDPFCGTGGILAEAALMGYQTYGSDINQKALEQAGKNLAWLMQQHGTKKSELFTQDAMKLDQINFSFDAIVTENYLGPVIEKPLTQEEAERMESHLRNIYLPFFQGLLSHVKKETPIVICLPVFFTRERSYHLVKTLAEILSLGYTTSALIPNEVQEKYLLNVTTRNSIVYHRENQLVGREIFRLFKK